MRVRGAREIRVCRTFVRSFVRSLLRRRREWTEWKGGWRKREKGMGEGCKDREGWSREGERWTTPGREERETRAAGGGDLARKKERETSGSPALLALRRLKARESARPRTRPGRDLLPSSFLHPVLSLSLSLSLSLFLFLSASGPLVVFFLLFTWHPTTALFQLLLFRTARRSSLCVCCSPAYRQLRHDKGSGFSGGAHRDRACSVGLSSSYVLGTMRFFWRSPVDSEDKSASCVSVLSIVSIH